MKKLYKTAKLFIAAALIIALTGSIGALFRADNAAHADESLTPVDGISYVETKDPVINPGIGFYTPYSMVLDPNNVSTSSVTESALKNLQGKFSIIHLQFGLEACSGKARYKAAGSFVWGQDRPITQPMLDSIDAVMNLCRDYGFTTIPRFSYNVYGMSPAAFEVPEVIPGGGSNDYLYAEPSKELMLQHLEQLRPWFNKHYDIIESFDVGMLGPWGEMHGTPSANNTDTVNAVINKLLDVVPETRAITVRYPGAFLNWYNEYYGESYTIANMGNITLVEGEPESRIGMFNDGYLGNAGDTGTFSNLTGRQNASRWLNKASRFITYGGEAINHHSGVYNNGYHRIEWLAWEGFYTHTSHLNIAWDDTLIALWQADPYRVGALTGTGNMGQSYPTSGLSAVYEPLYEGATAFDYIRNRLGYRFVLRDAKSNMSASLGGAFKFEGSVENMGFGNTVLEKKAQLIFAKKDGTQVFRQDTDIDTRTWLAKERGDLNTATVPFSIEADLKNGAQNYPEGIYDVYLRIYNADEKFENSNMRTVRFANEGDFWSEELGANRIGTVRNGNAHLVTFNNVDGSLLGYADAAHGGEAVWARELPEHPGKSISDDYDFLNWSINLNNITSDVTATAVFSAMYARRYEMTFVDHAGETVDTKMKEYGSVLANTDVPASADTYFEGHYRYDFESWQGFEAGVTTVDGNLTFIAKYKESYRSYRIVFNLEGGTRVSGALEQDIVYGQSAAAPETRREGYMFIGWHDSLQYLNVDGDAEIHAIWMRVSALETNWSAEVDLSKAQHIEFFFIMNSDTFTGLNGNGITANDYIWETYTDSETNSLRGRVIIKWSFIEKLSQGDKAFTANFEKAGGIDLTLIVKKSVEDEPGGCGSAANIGGGGIAALLAGSFAITLGTAAFRKRRENASGR